MTVGINIQLNLHRKVECHFRQFTCTSESDLQRLNIFGIPHKATSDSDILANYNLMILNVEVELDSHDRKDVLHAIVSLYINLLLEIIIQRYKIAANQTRARALHKEISRSCQGEK